jgi:hypothetical protein
MATERSSVARPVVHDLQRIFGNRLEAVAVYGWRRHGPVPTIALVHSLSLDDLNACAARAKAWRQAGAATPLLLTRADFARSLDAFPIEYGEIISHHEVVFGSDPFDGLSISRDDLRRACEVQVKSHLLHLREDYVESGGRHGEVDALVRDSAPGFAAILRHLARLDKSASVQDASGLPVEPPPVVVTEASRADLVDFARRRIHLDPRVVGDLVALADADGPSPIDAVKLFPEYLEVMERLSEFVDRWSAA